MAFERRVSDERRQLPDGLWRSVRPFLPELRLSRSGISKALHPVAGKAEVAALGVPDVGLFLWLTVACQIAGGLMGRED